MARIISREFCRLRQLSLSRHSASWPVVDHPFCRGRQMFGHAHNSRSVARFLRLASRAERFCVSRQRAHIVSDSSCGLSQMTHTTLARRSRRVRAFVSKRGTGGSLVSFTGRPCWVMTTRRPRHEGQPLFLTVPRPRHSGHCLHSTPRSGGRSFTASSCAWRVVGRSIRGPSLRCAR